VLSPFLDGRKITLEIVVLEAGISDHIWEIKELLEVVA
jgi:hypothetical protein